MTALWTALIGSAGTVLAAVVAMVGVVHRSTTQRSDRQHDENIAALRDLSTRLDETNTELRRTREQLVGHVTRTETEIRHLTERIDRAR